VRADWASQKEAFLNIADAMPDNKFTYKPTPAQGTYGERIMHVVLANNIVFGLFGGKTPAPAVNAKASSKADVVAALNTSMDYGAATLKEFNDQQLAERVMSLPFMGPTVSRLRVAYFSIAHTQDIYGQLAVYLRLSGGTPPRSARP